MKLEVSMVQRRLPHYRIPLFQKLRVALAAQHIKFRLLYGKPTEEESEKNDSGDIEWAESLPTKYFFNEKILWQPFSRRVVSSDLIIISQENKHIHNIPMLLNPLRTQKIAFFAHGRNLQADNKNSVSERFKRWTTNRVDWWFAYTELTAALIQADGFPESKISVVNNSIDTSALAAFCEICKKTSKADLKQQLGINPYAPTAVFIGSLTAEKQIDVLLHAAKELHQQLPGFQLAIGGDGVMRPLVQTALASMPFIHWFGSVTGIQKAQLLMAADVMLQPGALGLGVLDAFVAGLPLVTLKTSRHGPEIAYLKNEVNALVVRDFDELIEKTVTLLTDFNYWRLVAAGARESSTQFSIDQTVQTFVGGIIAACGHPMVTTPAVSRG